MEVRAGSEGGAGASGRQESRLGALGALACVRAEEWAPTPRLQVRVGETALVFYRGKNLSSRAIVGVASYNMVPMFAGCGRARAHWCPISLDGLPPRAAPSTQPVLQQDPVLLL